MSDRSEDAERAAREAADWAARFNGRTTDTETLAAFARWRRDPVNAHAYERVEAAWDRAAHLGADRDIAEAVHSALDRTPRRSPLARLRDGPLLAALIAVLVVGAATFAITRPTVYSTAVGEQRLVRLADGSRVHINTDSRLRVRIGTGRRELELVRGEAFFEVAHDTSRPFTVTTDHGRVVAVGTRFDVDRRESGTQVTLADGRLRIYDDHDAEMRPAVFLRPGETIRLGHTPRDTPRPIDVDKATSWLGGQLVFQRTPLATAIAEVNRYSEHKIELDAPDLGRAEVDGRFETGDVDAFVGAVTTLFPLRATTSLSGQTVLRPAG